MKKFLTYLIVSTSIFLLVSCDKPAPTQLVDDTDSDFEVELLNKNIDDQYISSGTDTSGITQDLTGITNLVSVSGIKITDKNRTREFSLAQAFFFDKSKPIKYSDGRLLSYQTITPGTIKINGTEANIVPYTIRYRDKGIPKDTLIGSKYLLYNLFAGWPDPFYYNYSSSMSCEFTPFIGGSKIDFSIYTPQEIIGTVSIIGSRQGKNLEAKLNWNSTRTGKVSIIIGLMRSNQLTSIPVYKIRTKDNGQLRFPGRYLNQLPLQNFEKIVITFVRSNEAYYGSGNDVLLTSAQSIHSIIIDIP
jgi:hypothetical protein